MMDQSDRILEVATKLARLRARMVEAQVDALVLTQLPSIFWLTAGASTYINLASEQGPSSLLITLDRAYVITDDIEARRMEEEERLQALGFTLAVESWNRRGTQLPLLLAGKRVGQDGPGAGVDLSREVQLLRTHLQEQEVERMRRAGALAGAAIARVMYALQPGMAETAIARLLTDSSQAHGGYATVNLIASDERIERFRHPLPTEKTVERFVMVILCMRYEGLIAAVTRFVHFGPLPDELIAKAQAMARVDARLILGTRAGRTMSDMFALADQAYHDEGYPTAVAEHHQGGSIAYLPREFYAQPDETAVITENQAFAWNPSVRGAKSEDTILLSPSGPEIITQTSDWPLWPITIAGQTVLRPAILER